MTPPLPPGHYAGDGHNHGAEVGHSHQRGHAHGSHESPDEHLHHMQERQSARGRATLEEFHRAAQETAQLRAGRPPETGRPQEARGASQTPQGRESSGSRPGAREDSAFRQNSGAFASGESQAGNARLFSPQGLASAAWLRGLPAFAQAASAPAQRPPAATLNGGGEKSSAPAREVPTAGRDVATAGQASSGLAAISHDALEGSGLQVLQQLHQALQRAVSPGGAGERGLRLTAELAASLQAFAREALRSPELLRSLPATLQNLVAQLSGISPKALQVFAAMLTSPAVEKGVDGMPGLQIPIRLPGSASKQAFPVAEGLLRGLSWMMLPAGIGGNFPSRLSAGLMQRLEKALLQFLHVFFGKSAGKLGAREEISRDELLMQQLAAMVAAKERRSKEQDRVKKKASVHETVSAKHDSDFSEHEEEDAEDPCSLVEIEDASSPSPNCKEVIPCYPSF